MAQPMRECPVCEAIVLLQQDHCTICGHDLSLPAPEPEEEISPPAPEVEPEVELAESSGESRLGDDDGRPREASVFVAIVGFVAAAVLILWFVRLGGPLDEDEAESEPAAESAADEGDQLELTRSVCAGEVAGVDGAPQYAEDAGIHRAAVLIGDPAEADVATSIDVFPAEWLVDVATQPLARSELVLCMSPRSVGQIESRCPSGDEPDGHVRLEATYRVQLLETATGDVRVDETVGPTPFGPCPADSPAGTVYADPDAAALVTLVVPVILVN